jgi:hypothetical protein
LELAAPVASKKARFSQPPTDTAALRRQGLCSQKRDVAFGKEGIYADQTSDTGSLTIRRPPEDLSLNFLSLRIQSLTILAPINFFFLVQTRGLYRIILKPYRIILKPYKRIQALELASSEKMIFWSSTSRVTTNGPAKVGGVVMG